VQQPTGGWKANAYVIFDYFSPTDFKFAGIDVAINKLQVGHRTAQGWVIDKQTNAQFVPNTFYDILIAIHGTNVTAVVGNKSLNHTFPARILDGESVGLNKGLIGVGSDNSRGVYDNITAQVLPPQITLDHDETFNDGVANLFTGEQSGTWVAAAARYDGRRPSRAAPAGTRLTSASASTRVRTSNSRAPCERVGSVGSSSTVTRRPPSSSPSTCLARNC
jgi:hypothetical protein